MSKRSKENKPEPKVGDNVTEPLSKQEIEQRQAEAEKDAGKSTEDGTPEASSAPAESSSAKTESATSRRSSSTLFNKKSSTPSQIEEKIEAEATSDLLSEQELEKTLMLSIEDIAKKHKLIAKQNGYTSISSNLQAIETVAAELRKKLNNTDYLVKKAKIV